MSCCCGPQQHRYWSMDLTTWIAENLTDNRPPIRLILLLHRLRYPTSHLPQKWITKLLLYRESLPPSERRSFDLEFSFLQPNFGQEEQSTTKAIKYLLNQSLLDGRFTSFSASPIWEKQQNFYRTTRLSAWQDVPFEISNNNLIADMYMRQIDCILEASPSLLKLCIVEVGAGHGILSLLLARRLSMVSGF